MKRQRKTSKSHKIKELEQEKIILGELNEYLSRKLEGLETDQFSEKSDQFHKIKELEQEKIILEDLNEVLGKGEPSLDELFTILSHEFRTPVVPIKAYTEMLLEGHLGNLNTQQKERLEMVRDSASSLNELITSAILSKKIERGEIKMSLQRNDVTKIINDIIATMEKELRQRGASMFYLPEREVFVSCDAERISLVLANLIRNSLKAVDRGSGEIRINLEVGGEEVKITIKDNGGGIPEDKLPKIFSKFYKTNMSETRADGGIGLGLYLCKQIIDLHGGRMWVESMVGKGTSVHFTLPKIDKTVPFGFNESKAT